MIILNWYWYWYWTGKWSLKSLTGKLIGNQFMLTWFSMSERIRMKERIKWRTMTDGEKRRNKSTRDFMERILKFLSAAKSIDHDETRTRNLLIRSQTPYPLGHAVIGIKILKMVLKHRIQGGVGEIIFFVCGASSKIKDLKWMHSNDFGLFSQ